ncbi:MAG: hypothetical protein Q8P54_01400 [bacterium]|nr:hypothetical protein [bacterium]
MFDPDSAVQRIIGGVSNIAYDKKKKVFKVVSPCRKTFVTFGLFKS